MTWVTEIIGNFTIR